MSNLLPGCCKLAELQISISNNCPYTQERFMLKIKLAKYKLKPKNIILKYGYY